MNALPYIPDYIIESVLGEGGMATVYQGVQQKLQRKVAIKVLDPALLKNKLLADRFMIEAQTAANLSHHNIISIYDVDHVGKLYYIVMELLDGSLKDLIKSSPSRKLPPRESLNIIKKIAPALDYAHKQGIIHRDIKPDNIMFRQDGTPVLVDFGIARAVDTDLQMTKTGMGIGTPHYMSPEQCQTGALDGRSDFYSLGVVLYEILTGEKPYRADTIMAVALKQIQEPVPKLPTPLARYQPLLDKMMAKNKEDRIKNGAALQQLIDEILREPEPARLQPDQTTQPIQPTQSSEYTEHTEPDEPALSDIDVDAEKLLYELDEIETVKPPASDSPVEPIKTAAPPELMATITSRETIKRIEPEEPPVPAWFKESLERTTPREIPIEPVSRKLYKEKSKKKSPSPLFVIILVAVVMLAIFAYFFYQGLVSEETGKRAESSPQQSRDTRNAASPIPPDVAPIEKTQLQDNSLTGSGTPGRIENKETGISKGNTAGKTSNIQIPASPPPAMSDDDTFKNAAAQNTVDAYRKYLDDYPTGRHLNEAMTKIEQLKEGITLQDLNKVKPKPTYSLRSGYLSLSLGEVEVMIKRHGFYDGNINPTGRFKNDFENKTINGDPVIIDHKTGLMWHPGGSSGEVEQKKIPKWFKDLNSKQYAGYTNWRLPTLEEAASLLKGSKNNKGLYIDPFFSGDQKRIWTGDSFAGNNLWVVRFYTGIVLSSEGASVHFIRPVRPSDQ
ncbi:MAG: serine/threonine-protein kinase PpkA [Acidobacteriota bacterium]|nr:serine/threonine-protein kinase PpkA [Acidobacteriota bacterium]